MEMVWKEEERSKEKGYEERERRKGVSLVFFVFVGYSPLCDGVGKKGWEKKNGEKEGGGWKRVSGHRGLWLVTHLLCGGLGVSPHPPLSPPPLVLCLVLSFSCPLPFPPCVCVSE